MKTLTYLLALAISLPASMALADTSSEFMVSGVLRSKEDGIVIKLVQGVKPAASAKDAAVAFTNEVLKQYPNYSLIDVIASPLEKQVKRCEKFTAI